ncbi:MAG: hypothetical protein ACUVV1_03565, partial [Fimbriimonadales bacterium]
ASPPSAWARAQQAEIIVEVLPTPSVMEGSSETLAKWLEASPRQYLLDRHDTVWVLCPWVAFLQRVPDLPYAAIRNLYRTEGDYNAWRKFYRATTPEQARWLLVLGFDYPLPPKLVDSKWEFYRGEGLASAWLMMAILEQLPPEQRSQLWNHDQAEPISIPLATLPSDAKIELASILEQWRASFQATHLKELLFLNAPAAVLENLALERHNRSWSLVLRPTPDTPQDLMNLLTWYDVRERIIMPEIVDPPDFIDP